METNDRVLIIEGKDKDKFGTYLYHDRDSGYYVPHIKLDNGGIVKPWDKEVVSIKDLHKRHEKLNTELDKVNYYINHWHSLS